MTKPFSVGDKVVALLAGGGYAEQVAVPAGQVLRVPDGVDLVTAASLPEVAATVYSNLIMTAQLQAGETVLIHGATGGIGTMAIQLAKAFGAKVATTAGTDEKVGTAKAFLGADIAINYARGGLSGQPAPAERRQGRGRHPRRRRRQVPANRTSTRWPTTAGWWSLGCRAAPRANWTLASS